MDAVTAAILGLSILLITGVVTWKECLAEGVAWDTLTWFAALIAMAGYLNKYGLISWFSQTVVKVSQTLVQPNCALGCTPFLNYVSNCWSFIACFWYFRKLLGLFCFCGGFSKNFLYQFSTLQCSDCDWNPGTIAFCIILLK